MKAGHFGLDPTRTGYANVLDHQQSDDSDFPEAIRKTLKSARRLCERKYVEKIYARRICDEIMAAIRIAGTGSSASSSWSRPLTEVQSVRIQFFLNLKV